MRLLCTEAGATQTSRGLGDWLYDVAADRPSLDLDFSNTKSLIDRISGQNLMTFTRASSATVIGPTGAIETVSNDVPRFQHDPTTGRCLGLLVEEQRTNLLLNSATLSTQSVTVSATAYTLSFYGTGTVTLSGTSTAGPLVGTGANARVSLTFTPTAGTLTLTVSGSVTNANLEAGSFATSWIPTTGTTATRSADVARITGSNFSRWYNQNAGTICAEALVTQNTSSIGIAGFDDTTANERWRTGHNGISAAAMVVADNNVIQASVTSAASSFPPGLQRKTAAGIATNDAAISASGQEVVTDALLTLPTVTQMTIGTAQNVAYVNGTISRLVYWGQRLPNSTLQSLTR